MVDLEQPLWKEGFLARFNSFLHLVAISGARGLLNDPEEFCILRWNMLQHRCTLTILLRFCWILPSVPFAWEPVASSLKCHLGWKENFLKSPFFQPAEPKFFNTFFFFFFFFFLLCISLFKIGKIPGGVGRVTVLWMAAGCVEAGSSAALPAAPRRAPESDSSSPRPSGSHFSNMH
ncbi:hypothetical protein EK904_007588 [Melospiza melodia maxima]|nr:hypothetical protein EK904_007588 [Melospiza melodia maxima]